jgi:hypothetical protein
LLVVVVVVVGGGGSDVGGDVVLSSTSVFIVSFFSLLRWLVNGVVNAINCNLRSLSSIQ